MAIVIAVLKPEVGAQIISNPSFSSDTVWNKGGSIPPPGPNVAWTISGGSAHATAATGSLTQTNCLVAGTQYRVGLDVAERTTGGVQLKLGTVLGTNRIAVGYYTEDFTSDGSDLALQVTGGGFTGSIGSIEVWKLKETFTTSAKFGGQTPKAAKFVIAYAFTPGTEQTNASFGYGVMDGTRQYCAMGASEHSQETSDSYRRMSDTFCIGLLNQADGTILAQGAATLIADGVEITWTTPPYNGMEMMIKLYGDNGVAPLYQGYASTFTSPSVLETTQTVTAPGWKPDQIDFISNLSSTVFNTNGNGMQFSIAYTNNDDGVIVSQASHNFKSFDNQATSSVFDHISSLQIAHQPNGTTEQVVLQSFDAPGFTIASEANGAIVFVYLAHKFNGDCKHWVGIVVGPSGSGNQSVTTPGFKPQCVEQLNTISSVTEGEDGAPGYIVVGMFDDTNARVVAMRDSTGQATSVTANRVVDKATAPWSGSGGTGQQSDFTSFDATGWTLNYGIGGVAGKWPTTVIGEHIVTSVIKDVIGCGVVPFTR